MTSSRKKIYTKYGDEGETSLLYGGRVSKENLHTEAYGTTDEAASVMGLARAMSQDDRVKEIRRQARHSWSNIRKAARNLQGLGHEDFGTKNVESTAKSCVRRIIRETGVTLAELEAIATELGW